MKYCYSTKVLQPIFHQCVMGSQTGAVERMKPASACKNTAEQIILWEIMVVELVFIISVRQVSLLQGLYLFDQWQ